MDIKNIMLQDILGNNLYGQVLTQLIITQISERFFVFYYILNQFSK